MSHRDLSENIYTHRESAPLYDLCIPKIHHAMQTYEIKITWLMGKLVLGNNSQKFFQ